MTAETLLSELRTKLSPSDLDLQIMSNFVLLAKKNKSDAETALNDFLQIASDEKHVSLTPANYFSIIIEGFRTRAHTPYSITRIHHFAARSCWSHPWHFHGAHDTEASSKSSESIEAGHEVPMELWRCGVSRESMAPIGRCLHTLRQI